LDIILIRFGVSLRSPSALYSIQRCKSWVFKILDF